MPLAFIDEYRSMPRMNTPFAVLKVDPDRMRITETLISWNGGEGFGAGTVAVEVGNEIWVGTCRGATIACFTPEQ
jgi:hypothetical protein